MARTASACIDLVDQRKRAGLGVYGETVDIAIFLVAICSRFFAHLRNRVQKAMMRIGSNKGRVRYLRCQPNRGKLTRLSVEAMDIDALTFLTGIGAGINEVEFCCFHRQSTKTS